MNKFQGIELYLKLARLLNIIPNFWLTYEYLSIQDLKVKIKNTIIWLEEDDWAIFPPLPLFNDFNDVIKYPYPDLKIWSDFENYSLGEELNFLDWEYTYDSNQFFNMEGGKWKVFRKNSRKWPRKNEGWNYSDRLPKTKEIDRLLIKWLEKKNTEEISDDKSLLWFIFNGTHRKFLYHKKELKAINVWDYNEEYLMYRYCITDPDEPFLDEFMRLLFYQRNAAGKLVIDGGVLDRPGLERFKDKINPIKKREVYSRKIS